MSYTAVIARIKNIRPIIGADRIKVGNVLGNSIIIGLDTNENDLGVFFSSDSGQLCEPYLFANDLVGYTDDAGQKKGGYFPKSGKIKTMKMRGELSEGYFAPLESLKFTGFDISTLEEGFEFTELNGIPICQHYYSTKTLNAMRVGVPRIRVDNRFFPEHMDTKQFRNETAKIPVGSILYFSLKIHGVSARYAYTLYDNKPKTRYEKFKQWLIIKLKSNSDYKYIAGSRRVIRDISN